MPKSTEKIELRPQELDFDARKLRDLEVAAALGLEVRGGYYNRSSKASVSSSSSFGGWGSDW